MTPDAFMARALELARRGIPAASPNPFVGCVLVKGGRIIGQGWHARWGGPHAEAVALRRAGTRARGATAYVTLEPCCHTAKKTPPCVPALVAAGVRRVVAGSLDPNPAVSGRGLRALRAAGIRTEHGVLAAECAELTRPFAIRMREGRPYVILKAAASLDGRIETSNGESKWITGPAARHESRRMRTVVDAILVGSGTVLADDPALTAHGIGRDPLRVILDTRLRIPRSARVLRGPGRALVLTASPGTLPGADVVRVPRRGPGLDLRRALTALAARGVGSVLVEGGSRVHTAFLEAGLVDELRLFLAPRLLGGAAARGFFEGRGFDLKHARTLRDVGIRRVGDDLLVTGYL